MKLSRRKFLFATGSAVAAGAGVGLYAWRVEPHWPKLYELPMAIRGLPAGLEGMRLAQISDIHVGPRVDSQYLIDCFRWVNDDIRPDMIAMTGDFMHCTASEVVPELERVLSTLRVPKLGIFSVMGNHDYGKSWANRAAAEDATRAMAGLGHSVLRNQSRRVAGLQVIGLDDLWSGCYDPTECPLTGGPSICLVHNPDAADDPRLPKAHWTLSGHTHGGQCKFPGFDPPMLPVKNKRYAAGEVDLGSERKLYVNRGLGYLRRIRFGVRPEITLFTLRAG